MSIDEAEQVARHIRRQPGWRAKVQLLLTLPEGQEEWTGYRAAIAQFEGDPNQYIVRSFAEWDILQKQLAEGAIR